MRDRFKVSEILAGDEYRNGAAGRTLVWTAVGDAELRDGKVYIRCQYDDGGISVREWDDPDHELIIYRP